MATHASPDTVRPVYYIGSRKSDLAMHQTLYVQSLLQERFPGISFEIRTSMTEGDAVLDKSLRELATASQGIFTKELEVGLVARTVDLVVHSLKDMPTTLPEGLVLAAITKREVPEDALVIASRHEGIYTLHDLPRGSVVGTSSVRREAFVRRFHPHLNVRSVRGNLNTRMHGFDALILARAGLVRMGWTEKITRVLPAEEFPPGVSQGALGIECRIDDTLLRAMVRNATEHPPSATICAAERNFLRTLQGGCQVPIGIASRLSQHADADRGESGERKLLLALKGIVMDTEGHAAVEGSHAGPVTVPTELSPMRLLSVGEAAGEGIDTAPPTYWRQAEEIGRALALRVISDGAGDLLGRPEGWTGADTRPMRPITYGSAEGEKEPDA